MAEISQQAVQAGAGMPPGNNVCTQREQNKWGINGPAKHACNSRKEPGAEQPGAPLPLYIYIYSYHQGSGIVTHLNHQGLFIII